MSNEMKNLDGASAASAAKAAHDMNNLLGAIMGYAQFILDDSPAGSANRAHAEKIIAAATQGSLLAKRLQPAT